MSTTVYTVGQFYEVTPEALKIGTNVRLDTHPNAKDFAASIKASGVLEAITAWVDEDGDLVVSRGQRRTLTAASVGTPTGTVPVRVIDKPDEVDRIAHQVIENVHRATMHEGEIRDAVEQLALLGVSAAQITKRTAIKRDTVNAALAVTGSETARDRMDAQGLTLEQAAAVAEFEGDESAIERLQYGIQYGRNLDHVVQRLRDERAEKDALLAEVERLRGEGLPVLSPEETPEDLHRLRMDQLVTAEGEEVDVESTDLPGLAVIVTTEWDYPEDGDEDDEEQTDEARQIYVPVWVCLDPEAAGLRSRWASSASADHSPEDASADDDAAREERRRVRENNAAWRSAETVRRDWLAQFASRKTPPQGAEALICEAVLTAPYSLTKAMERHHKLLGSSLGSDPEPGYHGATTECARLASQPATPKAHTMRTLAAVVLGWEESTDVHTWRNPDAWSRRIMSALIEWGYEPSDVEQLLVPDEGETDAA